MQDCIQKLFVKSNDHSNQVFVVASAWHIVQHLEENVHLQHPQPGQISSVAIVDC